MGELRWPPPPAPPLSEARAKYIPREQSTPKKDRADDAKEIAEWFRDVWCAENGITAETLQALTGLSLTVASAKLADGSLFNFRDIRRFPPRYRRELLFAYEAWCVVQDAKPKKSEPHR